MESPARGIRFIHQAISREAREIERLAAEDGGGAQVAARLPFFRRALRLHTSGEEMSIFADLAQRAPHVPAAYLLDHREEEHLLDELERAAAQGGPGLPRAAVALTEHLRLHIRKEEELVVPLLEEMYTPAELGAQIVRMMATFTPADFAAVLPWLITWLDPEDRRAYLAVMEAAAPQRMPQVLELLRAKLTPEAWQSLGR